MLHKALEIYGIGGGVPLPIKGAKVALPLCPALKPFPCTMYVHDGGIFADR